jgi:SAM-dependent methyltransferase
MESLADHFGERIAARYEESEAAMFADDVVDPAVDLLAELAAGGRVLELGIGTGRIAVPLSRRGVEVAGIDLSSAMVERLHAKPGGEAIAVTLGDFASARVEGTFSLAYLVFNTIMNLTTQDSQVECFGNVAGHLAPGGHFVVEVLVPELQHLPPGRTVIPYHVSETRWAFDVYDVATQACSSNYFEIVGGVTETTSIPFRYVWASELDLMARIAGLSLVGRWGDWRRTPFDKDSRSHVSVWQKPVDVG